MATNSVVKSHHGTLTTTNEDIVKLTQFWDTIEVENKDGSNALYVRFGGTAATSAGAGTDYVGPNQNKTFRGGIIAPGAVVGSTSTPPHYISLIGSGNAYAVTGIAGQS